MKLLLATIAFCLLLGLNIFAQTEPTSLPEKIGIEDIYLAKDDGSGKAGDAAESFLTTDIPIYCVVMLDSTEKATVKMNLVVVNVKGVKPETKVFSVSYKTDGQQNRVNFTGRPDGVWIAGQYRIDVFIDDKLAGNRAFEIKKSPSEIQKALPKVGSLVPPKPAPKISKRTRKN